MKVTQGYQLIFHDFLFDYICLILSYQFQIFQHREKLRTPSFES